MGNYVDGKFIDGDETKGGLGLTPGSDEYNAAYILLQSSMDTEIMDEFRLFLNQAIEEDVASWVAPEKKDDGGGSDRSKKERLKILNAAEKSAKAIKKINNGDVTTITVEGQEAQSFTGFVLTQQYTDNLGNNVTSDFKYIHMEKGDEITYWKLQNPDEADETLWKYKLVTETAKTAGWRRLLYDKVDNKGYMFNHYHDEDITWIVATNENDLKIQLFGDNRMDNYGVE